MSPQSTPRARIEGACRALGRAEVVQRCLRLLEGSAEEDLFLLMLGGESAARLLERELPPAQAYWVRTWAARGLLWSGVGRDLAPLRSALGDDAWRVREMACKVVARHCVGELVDTVAALTSDPVPRVRVAATRAVTRIVEHEA